MKKILSLLFTLLLSLQLVTPAYAIQFTDLTGVAADLVAAIERLESDGIVHGYGDNTFHPNQPVSEQEFARLLLRAKGMPELVDMYSTQNLTRIEALRLMLEVWNLDATDSTTLFADLNNADQGVVALFSQRGIVRGYSANVFGPNGLLTRAEAAKIILNSRSTFSVVTNPEVTVSQNVVEIIDVSPMTLRPSGSGSVLFVIKNNGDPESGLVYRDDYFASVVSGGVTITGANELGNGLYQLTFRAPANAPSAPVNIRITAYMGSVYSTDINEFLAHKNSTRIAEPRVSLAQLIPSTISTGNTAQIIVTPQDGNGGPVSGLDVVAEVTKGSGDIIEQMAESPAGSGIYVGTYKARGQSGSEIEITIRVNNLASRPQTIVRGTVR